MAFQLLHLKEFLTLQMSFKSVFQNNRSRRVILILTLLAMAGQFVRSSLGTFSIVEGVSMLPTFQPNDVVQARTTYIDTQRGDVVIVTDAQGERVIKRVVGLPGEKLVLYRGFVYINGQRLTEPYLPKYTYTFKSNELDERAEFWQLTDNEYFVLGDNRSHSTDSRHYGPVTRAQILSVVNTPANSLRPGFDAIMFLQNGVVVPGRPGHHDAGQSRSPNVAVLRKTRS